MVNAKKLKKKERLAKKEKQLKTREERQSEVDTLKEKLRSLGLGDGFPEILGIHNIMETYIEQGEAQTHSIQIPGIGRRLQMILPTRSHLSASITAVVSDPKSIPKDQQSKLNIQQKVKTVAR